MKNQALFSLKDKSKKLKCRLLQFLFGALRVKYRGTFQIVLSAVISGLNKHQGKSKTSLLKVDACLIQVNVHWNSASGCKCLALKRLI